MQASDAGIAGMNRAQDFDGTTAILASAGRRSAFYGWKLVSSLWFLDFLNMGFPLYGGAVINVYMMKQIAMPRSTYGLGFTLLNIFVGVPSIAIAASILRWGVRKTFLIGSGLIFAGSLWMAFFASQPWHYLVGFGVLIGTGIGFGTIIPLATAITRWFRRYRGRAMAIAMTASGFAGLAAAPLMNKLLAASGGSWRLGWMIVAGIAVLSAIVSISTIKESPEDLGQEVDGGVAVETQTNSAKPNALVTRHVWLPAEAYRTLSFWMIFVGSVACQFPFFFFTAHWILHLRGLGVSAANAALAMGLFTMGSIPGGIIGGWLMDRLPARFAFMLGLGCYLVGSLLAIRAVSDSLVTVFAAAILYGAGFRWSFVCLNTITGHFYGPAAYPKISGTMLMLSALACSPAGIVGGKLFDVYKSYNPAFELNILVCLVGICALAFARMPHQLREPRLATSEGESPCVITN
jgi:MFS family permease